MLQIPSIILPRSYALGTGTLPYIETIADTLVHTSIEFPVEYLQEKTVQITATEVAEVPAAVPGPLWCWVELSPYPTANSLYWPEYYPITSFYWAAIGGGGGISWATLGLLPPISPHIEVSGLAGGAGILVHTIILPWTIHSAWARVVLQTPAMAANTHWIVQVTFSAKTP
jgi:hypothetical protein